MTFALCGGSASESLVPLSKVVLFERRGREGGRVKSDFFSFSLLSAYKKAAVWVMFGPLYTLTRQCLDAEGNR